MSFESFQEGSGRGSANTQNEFQFGVRLPLKISNVILLRISTIWCCPEKSQWISWETFQLTWLTIKLAESLGGSFCQKNVVITSKITKYSKLEQQWGIEGNDFLEIFHGRDCKVVQKGPGSGRESGTVWKSLLRILQERVCKGQEGSFCLRS